MKWLIARFPEKAAEVIAAKNNKQLLKIPYFSAPGYVMELFLFFIASIAVYIAYILKKAVVPLLKWPGAFPYEDIRGKAHTQVEILLPRRVGDSHLKIEYEVTYAGLVRTLTIDALAIFNSVKPDKRYIFGQDLRIESTEFSSRGSQPGRTSLTMRQKFVLQGYLNVSPEAFDFLVSELNRKKSMALRVFGCVVEEANDAVKITANSFVLVTEGATSGPEWVREEFSKYIEGADHQETEFLRKLADRFEINKR